MCKAEDKAMQRALEAYPKETRDISGFVIDIGHPQYIRDFFIEGYQQAEKDNELTWEDLALIRLAFDATESNINHGSLKISKMTKEYYQEVLKRFKDLKNERPV